MEIQFTTSIGSEARIRIKKVEPDMPEERVERFVKAVDDGLIRIGDPMMYPTGIPVFPTSKGEAMREELIKMLS